MAKKATNKEPLTLTGTIIRGSAKPSTWIGPHLIDLYNEAAASGCDMFEMSTDSHEYIFKMVRKEKQK